MIRSSLLEPSKLNAQIVAVTWRLVGGRTDILPLFSQLSGKRHAFQLPKSRWLSSVPLLLRQFLTEWDEPGQSISPCVNQDSSARPQKSFFSDVSVSVSSVLPLPQEIEEVLKKKVIEKGCFVMSVMYRNCHSWETKSPTKSRNCEPLSSPAEKHLPLESQYEWTQQTLFCASCSDSKHTSTLTVLVS